MKYIKYIKDKYTIYQNMRVVANLNNLIIGNSYELVLENGHILSSKSTLVNILSNIYPHVYSFTNCCYNDDDNEIDHITQFKQTAEGYHCQFVDGLFTLHETKLIQNTNQDNEQMHQDKVPDIHKVVVYLA